MWRGTVVVSAAVRGKMMLDKDIVGCWLLVVGCWSLVVIVVIVVEKFLADLVLGLKIAGDDGLAKVVEFLAEEIITLMEAVECVLVRKRSGFEKQFKMFVRFTARSKGVGKEFDVFVFITFAPEAFYDIARHGFRATADLAAFFVHFEFGQFFQRHSMHAHRQLMREFPDFQIAIRLRLFACHDSLRVGSGFKKLQMDNNQQPTTNNQQPTTND